MLVLEHGAEWSMAAGFKQCLSNSGYERQRGMI